ncbi:MAG TPA: translation initiation factor IF-3 [Dehalococcoidia bacterium]|nr:translation initiation factor IF-3 [Dehalococcoidia bacterium]
MARQYRVNDRITSAQVRVIGEDGSQLGVMTVAQAIRLAQDAEVDLVEVAPNSEPPVCRLLDYGKLRYLTAKKDRESRKGQKSTELREVRFRPNIGSHDLESKTRKVRELILDGSKVKLTVRFRGREAAHQQLGLAVLKRVADDLRDEVRLEKPPALEGRALSMILLPTPQKPERTDQKPEVEDQESEETDQNVEATDQKPKAAATKPKATAKKPKTTDQKVEEPADAKA